MYSKSEDYTQLQLWDAEDLPPLEEHDGEKQGEEQPAQTGILSPSVQLALPGCELDEHD
jgi:hypothetical protein